MIKAKGIRFSISQNSNEELSSILRSNVTNWSRCDLDNFELQDVCPLQQLEEFLAKFYMGLSRLATPKELPIIHIGPLYGSDQAAKTDVARQIKRACLDVGFFYVTGHHIADNQHIHLLQCIHQMFDLSEEAKLKTAAKLSPLHRGYTGLGGSHNCTQDGGGFDQKESYLIGAEGSASPMHGPNQWPPDELLPHWKDQVQQYFKSALQLSRTIAAGLALSLSLPEVFFEDKMQDPVAQLLLLRYPPPPQKKAVQAWQGPETAVVAAADCGTVSGAVSNSAKRPTAPQSDQEARACSQSCWPEGQPLTRGCGAHTDCGFITILAQDDVPGLEVKLASGEWVQAPMIPGAYLVNLGDMMSRWSNDMYKSTEHRVFNHSSRARHSAPFFCNCDFHAVVEPIMTEAEDSSGATDSCDGPAYTSVSSGNPSRAAPAAKYPPIEAGRYIMDKLGLMWEG